jgi:uncharacterized membrane protein
MTPRELVLVLLSALLHAGWNAAMKGSPNPAAFLLAVEVASLAFFVPVAFVGLRYAEIPRAVWALVVATAAVHALYAHWLSRAYTRADLTVVYPIARSTPAFLPLIAIPLFGDHISVGGALGIALVVAGMWAVQTDGRLHLAALARPGTLFAYLTLATTVAYSLVDKAAMQRLGAAPWSGPVPRSIAYMALFYFLYLPLFGLASWRRARPVEVWAALRRRPVPVAASAATALASYGLALTALETAPVSYVAAVRQASVLFAVALGVLLLRERPGPVRLLGALANVCGVALIALAS